jgi:hypothetical protein
MLRVKVHDVLDIVCKYYNWVEVTESDKFTSFDPGRKKSCIYNTCPVRPSVPMAAITVAIGKQPLATYASVSALHFNLCFDLQLPIIYINYHWQTNSNGH